MALTPGARLGPYEVVALIGSGAMGEVYRARDPRLGRDVAIKVLPSAYAENRDRLLRFEQEARAAAALNDPNILAVFDVGHEASSAYIVSELLEGQTLRELLREGPLPVRRAVECAVQIVQGLAAAHEKGIVHRDLKPENVFLVTGGRVKILDFGLAKLVEPAPIGGVGSVVPTTPGTQPGLLLGTLGYMSPEQVRGLPADFRSDIFSFGAIFYEMLTGHRAFQRETAADTMSAILKDHPAELHARERHVPPLVVRIVDRCLEKLPAMRFQSTEDLAFALTSVLSADSDVGIPAAPPSAAVRGGGGGWIVAAGAVVAAMALAAFMVRGRQQIAPGPSLKMNLVAPPNVQVDPAIRLSPDGTRLAFAAVTSDGTRRLWLRPLTSLDAYPLTDTDGATQPFWSPNGGSLGFFAGGQLRKVDVAGGGATTIGPAPQPGGGTWNDDGVIVFSSRGQLYRVSSEVGGSGSLLNGINGQRSGATLAYPTFLPDGRHLLYLDTGSGAVGEAALYGAALDSADRTLIVKGVDSSPWYSRGYLFYLREGDTALLAQPFDPEHLTLGGSAVPIVGQVYRGPRLGAPGGAFSVSDRVLAYRTGVGARGFPTQLNWFDRSGKVVGSIGESADYGDIELSPDGTRAMISELDPGTGRDLWIFDLARGLPTRFTSDPGDELAAVWSPDGSKVIFASSRKGHFDLYEKAVNGAGDQQDVLTDNRDKWPTSWSADGRTLVYGSGTIATAGVGPHLWALPFAGDRKAYPLLNDPQFTQFPGKLSPDGRWLIYVSNESGQSEVYITSFPSLMGKWRVSTAGGNWPRWRRDGKEVFFVSLDNTRLMSVPVEVRGDAVNVGPERLLFETRWRQTGRYAYDVAPDGRILGATINTAPTLAAPMIVVIDWLADLKK